MEKLLSTYIQEALDFYSIGKWADFKGTLEKGIAKCTTPYSSYDNDLAKAYALLAAHHTNHAFKRIKCRTAYQAMAINNFDQLDSLGQREDPHLQVTKGYLWMLSSSRAQDADALFIRVLRKQRRNILALIGRACLAYNRQDYIGALGYFKSVLMIQPQGPVDVRVGIGHCFRMMGELEKARMSFQMALEYNAQCQNAMLGLALIKLNQREEQTYQEGKLLLAAAFDLNKHNPDVLSILASLYYLDGNHKMVWCLAGNALRSTDSKQMESLNYFQIAKSYHATGQFESAKKFYVLSVKVAPEGYVLPYVGMAQMYLNEGELHRAKACLEAFLKYEPDEPVVMGLLAKIYLEERSPGQIEKAIEMLVKVVASYSRDFNSWLSLAFAYEQKRLWPQTVNAYQKAISICSVQGHHIPIEWLNNLANSQLMAKMPAQALETLDDALSKCRTSNGDHKTTNLLTLHYNRGLVLEELHRFDLAEENYKGIIKGYPTYYDCYLRLGVMAMQKNELAHAIEYFKDVLNEDNSSLTARTYMGDCFNRLSLDKYATFNYNMILASQSKFKDTYVTMAMGNFCLKKLQTWMAGGNFRAARKQQEKALHFFGTVLDCNPRNLWAANGIGAVLSSCKNLSAGAAIFMQIIESGNKCLPAILNSAHIALERGQYRLAIQTYERCLKDFLPKNCVDVMHYLAKALYDEGSTRQAKMWLLKVRHLAPQDPFVIFNLALTIKKEADQALALPRPQLDELKSIVEELKVAYNYFYHLNLNHPKISVHASAKCANECQKLMVDLVVKQDQVRESLASAEDRIRLQNQRYQAHLEHLRQQARQREEEDRVLRENQNAQRMEVLERARKIFSAPLLSEVPKKSTGNGRGRKNQQKEGQEANKASKDGTPKKKSCKRAAAKEQEQDTLKKPKSREFIDTDDDSSDDGCTERRLNNIIINHNSA
ncbi:RNA polymerase-associated protein CTR9 homolog [Drosophila yakuba]|uniref:Uncharacterized protein n=1 Tax=Drosophila yakuba TaxID=7245 RepID=B4P942_DROYA|nr:RNA polymerase-associated protein CTR9 homolog [Drosophila yakuba]EDW92282.1 uncharacterized protein Dyak_GE14267 [Drosophila yakuba]